MPWRGRAEFANRIREGDEIPRECWGGEERGRATTRVAPRGRGDGEGMMLEGEGRFPNRPYGGGDGFPPPVFTEGRLFAGKMEKRE